MAKLGRISLTLQDSAGNALQSVEVRIRKQAAYVNGAQSGASPLAITVRNPGGVVAGDTVRIGTGTTEYAVDAVTATTVTLSGFGGTLNVSDGNRIVAVTNQPALYSNPAGTGSALTQPLQTDVNGKIPDCFTEIVPFQMHLSNGPLASDQVRDDEIPDGDEQVASWEYNTGAGAVAFVRNVKRAFGASDKIESWRVLGAEVAYILGTGTFHTNASVDVDGTLVVDGAITFNAALTISAGGAAITGNSTITGTLTVSSTLIASSGFTLTAGTLSLPAGAIETADLANNATYFTNTQDGTVDQLITAGAYAAGNYVDVTGCSVTFTPFSTNSEVVVLAMSPGEAATNAIGEWFSAIRDAGGNILAEGNQLSGGTTGDPVHLTLVHCMTGLSGSQTFKVSVQCARSNMRVQNSTHATKERVSRIIVMEFKK